MSVNITMRTLLLSVGLTTMTLSLASVVLSAAPPPPSTQPVHTGSHMIAGEHLAVELMDPNDEGRYNRGVRFTPVAAVVRATCDGHEFLFHAAKPNPLTDVAGLFAEFDAFTDPPGFAEAKTGETFVKIGVGALRKLEGKYRFYDQYPIDRLARTKVTWEDAAAQFEQSLAPVNGYGYDLRARVSVADRTLTLAWTLTNIGTKPLATTQYLHNSFSFDGQPVGPDYTVTFPFDLAVPKLAPVAMQQGRQIGFKSVLTKPMNLDVNYPMAYDGPNELTIHHATNGMAVAVQTSLAGQHIAIHAAPGYVCPEQFVSIELKPGENQAWTRTYTFGIFPKASFDDRAR